MKTKRTAMTWCFIVVVVMTTLLVDGNPVIKPSPSKGESTKTMTTSESSGDEPQSGEEKPVKMEPEKKEVSGESAKFDNPPLSVTTADDDYEDEAYDYITGEQQEPELRQLIYDLSLESPRRHSPPRIYRRDDPYLYELLVLLIRHGA